MIKITSYLAVNSKNTEKTQSSREMFHPGMGEISALRLLKSVLRAYQLNNKHCKIIFLPLLVSFLLYHLLRL